MTRIVVEVAPNTEVCELTRLFDAGEVVIKEVGQSRRTAAALKKLDKARTTLRKDGLTEEVQRLLNGAIDDLKGGY